MLVEVHFVAQLTEAKLGSQITEPRKCFSTKTKQNKEISPKTHINA